jgi:hypothetical protein
MLCSTEKSLPGQQITDDNGLHSHFTITIIAAARIIIRTGLM